MGNQLACEHGELWGVRTFCRTKTFLCVVYPSDYKVIFFCDNPSSWRKSIFLYKHAVNLYIYEVKHIGCNVLTISILFITYGVMVLLTLLYYH